MAKRWYIVHAFSNFENKVAQSLREQAVQRKLDHLFDEILVPSEEVAEVRKGRRIMVDRKLYPGYVLVNVDLTDEAYHLIKNTPKVTGFLGADKSKPVPISQAEADRIKGQVVEAGENAKKPMILWKTSTTPSSASRLQSRSSVAPHPWSWNTARSKRSDKRPYRSSARSGGTSTAVIRPFRPIAMPAKAPASGST
jgi:transcription termination/antitermination protein NusG